MSHKDILNLIKAALSKEGDSPRDSSYDSTVDTYINIRHADFSVTTPNEYKLNLESVETYDTYSRVTDSVRWDGDHAAWVIFKFDKGWGLAQHTGWWGPTFSGDEHTLDISENLDMGLFDKLCLTDEIREKAIDFMAEKILLND